MRCQLTKQQTKHQVETRMPSCSRGRTVEHSVLTWYWYWCSSCRRHRSCCWWWWWTQWLGYYFSLPQKTSEPVHPQRIVLRHNEYGPCLPILLLLLLPFRNSAYAAHKGTTIWYIYTAILRDTYIFRAILPFSWQQSISYPTCDSSDERNIDWKFALLKKKKNTTTKSIKIHIQYSFFRLLATDYVFFSISNHTALICRRADWQQMKETRSRSWKLKSQHQLFEMVFHGNLYCLALLFMDGAAIAGNFLLCSLTPNRRNQHNADMKKGVEKRKHVRKWRANYFPATNCPYIIDIIQHSLLSNGR